MKKITLLVLFAFQSVAFAQGPWNFNGTDESWTPTACTVTTSANSVVLTTNGATNPTFGTLAANVDATTNKYAAITMKVPAGGPTYLRISFPNTTSGRVYKPVVITNGDTEFKTYYVDLTNANWTGTVNDIKLHFKDNDSSTAGANHTSTGVAIEIDKFEIVQFLEKNAYEFNTAGDAESWTTLDCSEVVAGGTNTLTPVVNTASKILQDVFAVNATNNKYVHIVYKNLSALNNQLRFVFKGPTDAYAASVGANVTIAQSMTSFQTLDIDLTAKVEWTGFTKNFQLVIRDTNNSAVVANGASAGDLVIDRIYIDNTATLSSSEFDLNKEVVVLYPNPVTNLLSVQSNNSAIESVKIIDITGKTILNEQNNASNINVENLNVGIYFAKVTLANGNTSVLKFVKK